MREGIIIRKKEGFVKIKGMNTMLGENVCRYYRNTARGNRCVFIGVAEWKALGDKYLQYCKAGGSGCPILASLGKKIVNNSGLRKGENSVLFKEG